MNKLDNEFYIDKTDVKEAFNQAAHRYDTAAVLQREVADRLLERLDLIRIDPHSVVDIGSGTGYCTRALKKRYRAAQVVGVDLAHAMLTTAQQTTPWWERLTKRNHWLCSDAEQLALTSQSVDMIFSNLTLQWCNNLEGAFGEFHRTLKPGGLFMFTSFGPDTLKELRTSWRAVDAYNHVNAFIDMHDIGDALLRAGFSDPVIDVETITLTYKEVMQLLHELKTIGAHNITAGRARGLTGRHTFAAMCAAYEQHRNNGLLPCTYEVVYGHAWRLERTAMAPTNGQPIKIAPHDIRRNPRR
ncbi:MAG: malonyl-CoA O-methyltransferase [Halothiobacillaceae bacterium]|nr:MAG: malonyl-CoA O-methyltransferase [Halothiobacillaceae bacterium]